MWLSRSACSSVMALSGTFEKRRTVRVRPSQPIMPTGSRVRGVGACTESMMEANPTSARPSQSSVTMREGTQGLSSTSASFSSPSMSGAVLR